MRILIDYRPALRARTGAGLWIAGLVEAMAASHDPPPAEVTVFSSSWKDRLPPLGLAGVSEVDHRVPGRVLNWLWHRREWPSAERLTGRTFDVVHSPSPLLIPTRSAAQMVTVHDLDFLDHPERGVREIRRDYAALAGAHARRAHGVVVSSATTARAVSERLGVPSDRITVCPVGAPAWPARPDLTAGRHILFVGTLGARKNVDRLLTAYAALRAANPDAPPLLLAGGDGPDVAPGLASPGIEGVERLGYVEAPQLRELYESAMMLVLPSLDEGFGIPVLEAMTVGVPVVVSDRGSLPEVAGEAGVRVDPLDPEAITAAMAGLLAAPARRARLAEAGIARASGFNWSASAGALRAAYTAACRRRRDEGADADRG